LSLTVLRQAPIMRQSQVWQALVNAVSFHQLDPCLFDVLDWNELIRLAEYHGVLPTLATRVLGSELHPCLHPETREQLKHAFQRALMRSLPPVQEVLRVTRSFREAGVPIIPYKGPVLAERYWGSFGVRECVDLDFLVRPENVERSGELLLALGYDRIALISPHLRRAMVKNASEEQFQHRETKLLLELQWAPAPRAFALAFESDALWAETREGKLLSESVLVPSPENLLHLLCIHGWKHNWSRLIWVADVARILWMEQVNWEAVEQRALRSRSRRIIALGLQMAHRTFGVVLPENFESDAGEVQTLGDDLLDRMRASRACRYIDWHRSMLAARDSPWDRIRQMAKFLMTPGLGEYATFTLPAALSPAYKLVRLARVARLIPNKRSE
jgi:hypothetical protein